MVISFISCIFFRTEPAISFFFKFVSLSCFEIYTNGSCLRVFSCWVDMPSCWWVLILLEGLNSARRTMVPGKKRLRNKGELVSLLQGGCANPLRGYLYWFSNNLLAVGVILLRIIFKEISQKQWVQWDMETWNLPNKY